MAPGRFSGLSRSKRTIKGSAGGGGKAGNISGKAPGAGNIVGLEMAKALEGTPLFVEADASYRTGKSDPGPRFTAAVRAGLADLGVTGP